MHCTQRDQDILLLQHGELSSWRAFWVRQHLAICPHCQEKSGEFAETSRLLAGAIRQDGGLPAFAFKATPVVPIRFAPVSPSGLRPTFALTASAVAALLAAGVYAYSTAMSPRANASVNPTGTVFRATTAFSPKPPKLPLDASGKSTIFPYSTPIDADACPK